MKIIRKVLGGFCILEACGGVFAAVAVPEPGLLSITVVFGLLAWLCFRKPKSKGLPNQKQQVRSAQREKTVEPRDTVPLAPCAPEIVEPVDAYIEADGTVYRTDGQPISDREVPYLIETGLQEAMLQEQNHPFRRSDAEQDLIFRFTQTHGRKSTELVSQFESLSAAAYKAQDLDEKINFLIAALQKYQVAKEWHYKVSKGGMMYFQDMWDHLHNSRNACFSWDEPEREYLKDLLLERDHVRPAILEAAKDGFMQKDFYAQFSPDQKSFVQRILRSMEGEGQIVRTKTSGSYFVTLP